ncbi:unnamed protein product [Blepharisma stoltei]|uniref:Uncharacterized protein n=1 Tax=Blepharisma stoltei TaxID=1481888 RepID=A0AAU9K6E4_9CILI|nr:unnamed protein product [Blepharisma stoltei]
MATPYVSTYPIKAKSISCSSNHIIACTDSSLKIYSYPSFNFCQSIDNFPYPSQILLTQGQILTLSPKFQVWTYPEGILLFTYEASNPKHFSVDRHDVALLLKSKIVLLSLIDLSTVMEIEIKVEPNKILLISGRWILLQEKYWLRIINFEGKEIHSFNLKNPGLLGFMNWLQPAPDAIHIGQYGLICITTDEKTFFVDYDLKRYPRYQEINHEFMPLYVAFLHPCYILAFAKSYLNIYLIHSGECIYKMPNICYSEITAFTYDTLLMSNSDSLMCFSSPSLDTIISTYLGEKRFDVALEICADTCSNLESRVYFEYGVHMFFQDRDYQRAAHYMRKSEEYWGVCSLMSKIVKLPPIVKDKCKVNLENAVERIKNYSLLRSHFNYIAQFEPLTYDKTLKNKIIKNFIPFFHMIRKNDDQCLRNFAESWIFSAVLQIPKQTAELLPIVRDPSNTLPLYYCEGVLKKSGQYDLMLELFLSRKIYRPGLEVLFKKYEEEKTIYWLIKTRDYLSRMQSNEEVFLEYTIKLFCESKSLAEELFLTCPAIIPKLDILGKLLPMMMKYSGPRLVIGFLSVLENGPPEYYNYLAKIYIEETLDGEVNPKELVEFLNRKPTRYDPETVLTYFPKGYLQRERCLLLDLIGRYEEIIHYYIYEEKSLINAKLYVLYKRNTEVSSIFISKLCKSPSNQDHIKFLVDFLNEANPEIIDHHIALSLLPKNLPMDSIIKYLYNAFHSLEERKVKIKLKRRLQETHFLDLILDYYKHAHENVEITEDTRCDICKKKIKTKDFIVTYKGEIQHEDCYEQKKINTN